MPFGWILAYALLSMARVPETAARRWQLTMACILLVDDEEDFRRYVRAVLESIGHTVIEAEDGDAAIELLERSPLPDLVITDLQMPKMDGIELLQYLVRYRDSLKILIMSGGGVHSRDLLGGARQLGAHDAIAKPFSRGELKRVVSKVLGG